MAGFALGLPQAQALAVPALPPTRWALSGEGTRRRGRGRASRSLADQALSAACSHSSPPTSPKTELNRCCRARPHPAPASAAPGRPRRLLTALSRGPLQDSPFVPWAGRATAASQARPGSRGLRLGAARLQPTGTAAVIGHICGRAAFVCLIASGDCIWRVGNERLHWAVGGGLAPLQAAPHLLRALWPAVPTALLAEGECGPSSRTRGTKEAGRGTRVTEVPPRSHQGPTRGAEPAGGRGEWGAPPKAASEGSTPESKQGVSGDRGSDM